MLGTIVNEHFAELEKRNAVDESSGAGCRSRVARTGRDGRVVAEHRPDHEGGGHGCKSQDRHPYRLRDELQKAREGQVGRLCHQVVLVGAMLSQLPRRLLRKVEVLSKPTPRRCRRPMMSRVDPGPRGLAQSMARELA